MDEIPFLATLNAHAAAFEGAWPDHPWDHIDPVYKLPNGRIFCFLGRTDDGAAAVTVKLGKDSAEEAKLLPFVQTAAYIGRHGWVTVTVRTEAECAIALEWIDRSHALVAPAPKARPRRR